MAGNLLATDFCRQLNKVFSISLIFLYFKRFLNKNFVILKRKVFLTLRKTVSNRTIRTQTAISVPIANQNMTKDNELSNPINDAAAIKTEALTRV